MCKRIWGCFLTFYFLTGKYEMSQTIRVGRSTESWSVCFGISSVCSSSTTSEISNNRWSGYGLKDALNSFHWTLNDMRESLIQMSVLNRKLKKILRFKSNWQKNWYEFLLVVIKSTIFRQIQITLQKGSRAATHSLVHSYFLTNKYRTNIFGDEWFWLVFIWFWRWASYFVPEMIYR